jgi:hypothetical protein
LCFSPSCVPYVARFFRSPLLIAPSVLSNIYLDNKCVLHEV